MRDLLPRWQATLIPTEGSLSEAGHMDLLSYDVAWVVLVHGEAALKPTHLCSVSCCVAITAISKKAACKGSAARCQPFFLSRLLLRRSSHL